MSNQQGLTIPEILKRYRNFWIDPRADILNTEQAQDQIFQLMNEVIGEDESTDTNLGKNWDVAEFRSNRNTLRVEQRRKAKALCYPGGDI